MDGTTQVQNVHTGPTSFDIGDRLVPAATGTSRTDDLAGRVAKADFTGAAATLAYNIITHAGFAGEAGNTADAKFETIIDEIE